MRKGEQTRSAILAAALDLAATHGLEGLTIGMLADRMDMSKSGVFAHFGSREVLQQEVLREYEQRFVAEVLLPALEVPRGLQRLRAILMRWLERTALEAQHGCIWISGAVEYDDRPGPVRDHLVAMVRAWQRELSRAIDQAKNTGELACDLDVDDLVFEIHGIVLALHHDARLLHSPDASRRAANALERLLATHAASVAVAPRIEGPTVPTRACGA